MAKTIENIKIGDRFGKLVVCSFHKKIDPNRRLKRTYLDCMCDCGNKTSIRSDSWRKTKSCGCIGIEELQKMSTKHNSSYTRLYKIYGSIKTRCYRKTAINYYLYGGRGITMCDEWLNDFMTFKRWALENGYNDTLTIDRIDTNKGYCPENCRWATMKEQQNNRRNNNFINFNGERHSMSEWGRITGIGGYNIYNRLQDGWSIEDALTKPVIKYRKRVWNKTDNGTYHHELGVED